METKEFKNFKLIKKVKSPNKTSYYFLGLKIFTKKKSKIKLLEEKISSLKALLYEIEDNKNYQHQTLINLIASIAETFKTTNNLIYDNNNIAKKAYKNLPIYIAAKEVHSKVFPKYKNCNQGKEIVILAAGPTLDYYTALEGKMHLGINRTAITGKAKLNYLFVQDYFGEIQNTFDAYQGDDCKKFYGIHYLVQGISQSHADEANAERYYFIDNDFDSSWDYPPDISILPFRTYSSVVHPAITFALWTGVSKIYLVGCDTDMSGYAKSIQWDSHSGIFAVDNILQGWIKMKKYADEFYPNTEIISINPVGLKGLFKDIYTENYLKDHPEIKNAEIMKAI